MFNATKKAISLCIKKEELLEQMHGIRRLQHQLKNEGLTSVDIVKAIYEEINLLDSVIDDYEHEFKKLPELSQKIALRLNENSNRLRLMKI